MVQLLESAERLAEIAKAGGYTALGKDLMKAARRQRERGLVPETERVVVFDRNLDSNKTRKPLTFNEHRLVSTLKEKPNEVFSEVDLNEKIYGQKNSRGSIKKLVSRTRRKIEADPKNPKHILTENGEGYLWKDSKYLNSELTYDPERCILTIAGTEIALNGRPKEVLELLIQNAGKVVTYNQFSKEIWNSSHEEKLKNLVRINIRFLRQKVERATGKKLESIVTEPWVGYKLVDLGSNMQRINDVSTIYVADGN